MRNWKLFSMIMLVMLGMITNNLMAQTVPINGTVLSDDGTPLAGVTVAVSGTKRATTTDSSGRFTINAKEGAMLIISYVGFANQKIKASAGMEVRLLQGESGEMGGVVVTALGIKKDRKALGYSVTELNAQELMKNKNTNVVNSLAEIGPRVSPGEYPLRPMGAGTTIESTHFVHPVNFNDLDSVRYVCQRYPIAAMITEPILQNIGVVRPRDGYLAGLRELADEFGFLLIFDEVKTGFRHSLGGYAEISRVTPDLVTYGKAIANGFPLAVVGGKRQYMDYIIHKDMTKRPFVAGTYNGHPVGVAAAIRTIEYLLANRSQVYGHVEELGRRLETGLRDIFAAHHIPASIARQSSALSYYLMPHAPVDLHDILEHHDFDRDVQLRRALIDLGVFFVPIATKQCSISAAHTADDIAVTLEKVEQAVSTVWPRRVR